MLSRSLLRAVRGARPIVSCPAPPRDATSHPRTFRRRAGGAVMLAAAVLGPSAPATAAASSGGHGQGADAATEWIGQTLDQIRVRNVNPPRAARALALVSVGMRNAADADGSDRGTVDGAAAAVLGDLFPDAAAALQARAASDGRSTPAVQQGARIGAAVVDRGHADGADVVWNGTMPTFPGAWVPTAPGMQPLEPMAGTWRPWNIASGSALRPPEPPRPGSDAFERDVREVYDVAEHLTAEQIRIASFWGDGAGTVTPPGHWNVIAGELIANGRLDTKAATRVYATLNTAQADAFIAAWDAKFAYCSVRPVTAIREAIDPEFTPLLTTPPFPSYVSGHSTTSAAAATVLGQFFSRDRDRLSAIAEEASISRLYGGIHYRSDLDAGLDLGRQVAIAAIGANY
jgi:membrane-associated phospholipid phosphatase